MTSTNTNIFPKHSFFRSAIVLRVGICLIAAVGLGVLPTDAAGQYFLPDSTPAPAPAQTPASTGYDYSYYNATSNTPAQPQPQGQTQGQGQLQALQPLSPVNQPAATQVPATQPPATQSYGGMPVTTGTMQANPQSGVQYNAQNVPVMSAPGLAAPNLSAPVMQPVPQYDSGFQNPGLLQQPVPQPLQQPGVMPQPMLQPGVMQQPGNASIQSERTRLSESNPVFDGEVEGLLNRIEHTDSPMPMQTFRTGSPDMIPSGVENLRPIEAERGVGQMQTQLQGTPSASGSGSAMFGVGDERSLAEIDDTPMDFSAIMQRQNQVGDDFQFDNNAAASRQDNPLAVSEDLRSQPGGRMIDLSNRYGVDRDVENLVIEEVVIEGNGKIPQHTIRNMIKTMPGDPFRLQVVQEDTRTLNQTGSFFSVTPRYQRKGDKVTVRFDLVERPIFHSVQFVGNRKVWKRTLEEQVGIKRGDSVDIAMVLQGRERLKEFYRQEGYERASVTIASGDRIDDRNVVYIINEGVKQRVLKTEIEGSMFVSSRRLRTYIESKPGFFYYIGGEFNRDKLDADVEALLDFYKRYGFLDVQIDRKFEDGNGYSGLGEQGSWITVKFIISEGQRFKINRVKFVGNQTFTEEELLKDIKLKPGNHYEQMQLLIDEGSINRKYGNEGLLLTKVRGNVRLLDDKPGEIDIIYSIRESNKVVASRINIDIVGDAAHTRTTTFLKYATLSGIKPGSVITASQMREAQNNLARGQFLANASEGQAPQITIKAEGEEDMEDLDGELLDAELQNIDDIIHRGQSPGGYPYTDTQSGISPEDWERIKRRSGVGTQSAFPEPAIAEYRVCYPQAYDGGVTQYGDTQPGVYAPSTQTAQGSTIGVQEGSYTIPPQYQGYQGYQGTTSNGTVTNGAASNGATYSDPLYDGTSGSLPGTVGMVDNGIIPATTNPTDYYGSNGYGSVTQASGVFPSLGPYDDLGAPGSVTRPANDILSEYTRANVIIKAQEGKTGNLTLSVGVNSDSGLVGRAAIEERNFDWRRLPTNPWTLAGWRNAFRGGGQRFMIEAMPGENYQRYQVSFQEPFIGNTRFSLGLNGFYYTRYYDEWRERRTGGGVTLGRAWTDRFSTSLSFNGANVKVYDPYPIPDLYKVLGNNAQYAFGISATYDTRDNAMMPTEGGVLTVTAEQVLGTSKFVRGGYDIRRYFTIPGTRRGDGSGGLTVGLRSAANVTEGTTPIYERYYAGGFSTIRGFDYRGVTPRWYGFGVGGNFEFYNSAELSFPLSADDNFRGVLFIDSGTVESSITDWNSEYRVAPGFGLRLNIPMMGPVPLAFDFAFPINKQTGDITQAFSFNMGWHR